MIGMSRFGSHTRRIVRELEERVRTTLSEIRMNSIGRRCLELVRDNRGGPLVEFAVVLPLTLTIMTGTASFSMFLYSLQQLQFTTASASQLVSSEQGLISDPCAAVVTSVTGSLSKWTAGNFTYTVVITDSSGTAHTYGPTTGSSFSCTAGAALMAINQPMSVSITYKYTWLPILSFSPSGNLAASQTSITE